MKSPEAKCDMNATWLLKNIICISSLLKVHKTLISGKHLSTWISGRNKTGSVLFIKAEDPLNSQTDSLIQADIRSL